MKRFISVILSLILLISSGIPLVSAHASEVKSTQSDEAVIINSNGEEIVYTIDYTVDGGVIEARLKDGTLIERSVWTATTVSQDIAEGKIDGRTFKYSDYITAISEAEIETSTSDIGGDQPNARNPWYDPPLMNDNGLSNSTIFSGYKYLGSTSPDSIYGVSVGVHRKLQKIGTYEAYRFTVSPGTTVSTLAGILIGGVTGGLPGAVATGLALAFIGAGIDSIASGTLKYEKYHYTFKFNCNGSSTYSYKCCECREWWCIYDAKGTMKGYEEKNMMADSYLTINIIAKCDFARQDYLNGTQTNVSCANAAA